MAFPEPRSSLGARLRGRLDGVSGLLSYLFFTSLQRHAPPLARGADRLGRRLRGRTWLRGSADTDDGPVAVAYFGTPDRMSRWLLDRLGAKGVEEVRATAAPGSVPCQVELVMIPTEERRKWGGGGWLVLPRYVHHRQLLSRPAPEVERRAAQRLAASGILLRMSSDARDLERFQRDLYDPMLERRHGDRALRTGRALLRLGQRRGGLLIAESQGRAVAAAVGAPSASDGTEFEIWALGIAADAPTDAGLLPVLGWVQWARERGFVAVDHLVSLPLYSDGLTRQKLRWGTEPSAPTESRELVALRVHGSSAALGAWLCRHTFAACAGLGLERVDLRDPGSLPEFARRLAVG